MTSPTLTADEVALTQVAGELAAAQLQTANAIVAKAGHAPHSAGGLALIASVMTAIAVNYQTLTSQVPTT